MWLLLFLRCLQLQGESSGLPQSWGPFRVGLSLPRFSPCTGRIPFLRPPHDLCPVSCCSPSSLKYSEPPYSPALSLPPSSHTPLCSSTTSPQGHSHTCIPMTSGFCHQLMLTSLHFLPFGPPLKLGAIQVRVRLLCSWAQSKLLAWLQPCVPPHHLPSETPAPPRSSAGNPFPLGQH